MKKYAVGDIITLEVRVTEVHPQGFPFGLHANGGPNVHPNPHATAEEKAAALVEQPDVVICEFIEPVEVDASKRLHLRGE